MITSWENKPADSLATSSVVMDKTVLEPYVNLHTQDWSVKGTYNATLNDKIAATVFRTGTSNKVLKIVAFPSHLFSSHLSRRPRCRFHPQPGRHGLRCDVPASRERRDGQPGFQDQPHHRVVSMEQHFTNGWSEEEPSLL